MAHGFSYSDYEASARTTLLDLRLSLSLGVHTLKETKNSICLLKKRKTCPFAVKKKVFNVF